MSFSTRNAYYLRASNYRTIPLFLYLDERHVDWMSDTVLQRVIASLQPRMGELLDESRMRGMASGNPADKGKKHKVYVERGEGFQFCYFLRGTTRTEVVLLKQKTYSLRPPTPPPIPAENTDSPRRAKSSSSRPTPARGARSRTRTVSVRPEDEDEDDPDENEAEEEDVKPDIPDETEISFKDYKPDVSVTYKGFGTSSLQLVLIIEPWPPLPSSSYAPPSSRLSTRSASVASTSARSRSQASRASRSGMNGTRFTDTAPLEMPTSEPVSVANMRNASRSISATPGLNSRRGGTASATPFGSSVTPGPGEASGSGRSRTPLFLPGPRDTPFDMDEEDEEAHERYTAALREGRVRLPSVSRPAGGADMGKSERRNLKRRIEEEEDELDGDDEPEGMEKLGERLVHASQMEESVVRVTGGWEERAVGESSEVLGREEAGE